MYSFEIILHIILECYKFNLNLAIDVSVLIHFKVTFESIIICLLIRNTRFKIDIITIRRVGLIEIHWLILSQFFHKWRNMVTFSKQFIFGIIERMKMQISTFCHFCHQKREFDVILMHSMWIMCFRTGAF